MHMPLDGIASRPRLGAGLFIGLAHLVLILALLRHAGHPRLDESGPVEEMIYLAIPTPPPPRQPAQAMARPAAPAPAAPRRVRPAEPATPAMVPVPMPAPAPAESEPQPARDAAAAPGTPRLDMAALRAEAGRIDRSRVQSPFEQVRDAESRLEAEKKDLGRAISNAKRPPCTKKYSGGTSFNVFALVPLAIDTITDTGCKW